MKKNWLKKFLACSLCLAMLVGLIPAAAAVGVDPSKVAASILDEMTASEAEITETINPEEWVTVIVELEGETTLDVEEFAEEFKSNSVGFSADKTIAAHRASLVDQQNDLQIQIGAINKDAKFKYHYTNLLNGFAARVQYKDIEAIKSLAGVAHVSIATKYAYPETVENEEVVSPLSLDADAGSIQQMGLEAAWEAGYTGAGKVIGVFDTSIRHTHDLFQYFDPAVKAAGEAGHLSNWMTQERILKTVTANQDSLNLFESNWGSWYYPDEGPDTMHGFGFTEEAMAEFLKGNYGAEDRNFDKLPFAVDYACGDSYAWDGDSSSHGNHVAGIAAGNAGPDNPITTVNKVIGGAKDAQIMFFKVFCEEDSYGSDEVIAAAMDDAVTLGVNAFNLSLGSDLGFSTMETEATSRFQRACTRALNAGISICISAGNSGRDAHSGSINNGYSTVEPNSSMAGLPGSLYGPFTSASAQGTGYIMTTNTTVATVNIGGTASDYSITDNNGTMVGNVLGGTYTNADFVNVGLGSEEEILAATGATTLEGALAGKIALVQRGTLTYVEKGQNVKAAGAIGMFMGNNAASNSALSASNIVAGLPSFGCIGSAGFNALVDALKAGTEVTISFASSVVASNREYNDNGPSSFTSWGVNESLDLKPDIMAPGGNIYSTGGASDTALSAKSGTSMASPNTEGAMTVLQCYVDDHLEEFGVEPASLAYTCLVSQLAASTAIPYKDTNGHYFSPRRQGAGMINLANAINSMVVLSNDQEYDPSTGNTPRAKVNLGDKVGDTFDITFNLTNYGSSPVIFDVKAVAQTDSTTTNNGRDILRVSGGHTPADPLPGTMKVTNITAGGVMLRDSENINAYTEGTSGARIVVDSETAVKVTVSVTLDAEAMAAFDAKYPNGMFVEGFVLLTGINGTQNVNLPYMGFRGDWNKAPIFDFGTAYDDITDKAKTDLDYPYFHTDTLNTNIGTSRAVLGTNQYTGAALPEYYASNSVTRVRSYLDTLRTNGGLSADFAAISPNGDGNADIAYAALFMLRSAKAAVVTVTDADGNVVKTMGPDFELYKAVAGDSEYVKQVTLTEGYPYSRDMAWDGTDAEGKVVADGQYNYNVYAITEYDYLNNLGYGTDTADVAAYVLSSETAHKQSFAVKVDTQAPVLTTATDGTTVTVEVSDNVAVQAVNCYYDGAPVGTAVQVNAATGTATFQMEEGTDMSKVTVQAVDYAMNVTTATVALPELTIVEQPTDYEGKMGENAAFSVTVNRADVTYQWYYSKNGGKSWGESTLTGADTATVTVPMKSDRVNQMYKCVVTDSEGNSVETVVVTMTTATEGLAIVTNPADYTGAVNEMATFTVEATGEGLSYQWMYSNNGGLTYVKSTAPTATTASVSIAVKAFRDGQMYKCVVTDASGNVVESAPATMTVSK